MDKNSHILYVRRDPVGCGYYRCTMPGTYVQRLGMAEVKFADNYAPDEQLEWADLVIFQEMGSPASMKMVKHCLEKKIRFVTEIDDFIHHVSPNNTGGYGAWNPATLYVYRAVEQMRKSFGLIVSTNQLAREYFPYNSNIFVVQNYLDQEVWDNPIPVHNDGKIRIGWTGGNAHGDDLKMISKVMDDIVKEYRGKVIFETMGMTPTEILGTFEMQRFPEKCPHCDYEGEMKNHPGEHLENYPMILSSKGWDIGIAPVINNSFGNAKSWLKIMEYSAIGAAIVASPVQPYREAKENGAEIMLADTYDEWYKALKKLIKSKELRAQIRKHNKEWISKQWIQNNAQSIFDIYTQFLPTPKSDNI